MLKAAEIKCFDIVLRGQAAEAIAERLFQRLKYFFTGVVEFLNFNRPNLANSGVVIVFGIERAESAKGGVVAAEMPRAVLAAEHKMFRRCADLHGLFHVVSPPQLGTA